MSASTLEHVEFTVAGQVGTLRVCRPDVLNALNGEVLGELLHVVTRQAVETGVRALILTGAGDKAFIAGADIKEMRDLSPHEMESFCLLGQTLTLALEEAPFVTVAAVNGYALGGGMEMALACDFIYASTRAKFGLPEVTLGLIPGFGGTQRLLRAVGRRQAKELVMSGKIVGAEEAQGLGVVNKVTQPEDLLEETQGVVESILKNAFPALVSAKRVINHGAHMGMREALELEKGACTLCFTTPDRLEGMTAFLEKRPAKFS